MLTCFLSLSSSSFTSYVLMTGGLPVKKLYFKRTKIKKSKLGTECLQNLHLTSSIVWHNTTNVGSGSEVLMLLSDHLCICLSACCLHNFGIVSKGQISVSPEMVNTEWCIKDNILFSHSAQAVLMIGPKKEVFLHRDHICHLSVCHTFMY